HRAWFLKIPRALLPLEPEKRLTVVLGSAQSFQTLRGLRDRLPITKEYLDSHETASSRLTRRRLEKRLSRQETRQVQAGGPLTRGFPLFLQLVQLIVQSLETDPQLCRRRGFVAVVLFQHAQDVFHLDLAQGARPGAELRSGRGRCQAQCRRSTRRSSAQMM